MCLIVDANTAHIVIGRPQAAESIPVWKWLMQGGVLVFGGENGRELIKAGEPVRRRLLELERAGRARNLEKTKRGAVDVETEAVRKLCRSDDPHVIALARISGARVVATADSDLHVDFKDKGLIDGPRGTVYQNASHGHLLQASDCPHRE